MGLPAKVTAQSLYVVYKQLPAEVQTEFRHLLSQDESSEEWQGWIRVSETALGDVWNTPENDAWDQFYAEHQSR
jgi:hypothetical protein